MHTAVKPAGKRTRSRLKRARPADSLPHRVRHQRVYIVPTRRGLAFLLALLLMLVASINYSLSLGYALSFLLTGLFAASLLHTYSNVAGMCIERISSSDCFAGERMNFTVLLKNDSRRERHGIRFIYPAGHTHCIHLGPGQSTEATISIPTSERGKLELGRLTLQSDWPVGLWTCWSYLHTSIDGVVYPAAESSPPPLPRIRNDNGEQTSAQTQSRGEVSGLRPYVPGDTTGSIAWKQAARGQGLMVRTFDDESGNTSKVTLTLQQTGKVHIEEQLSRLCAWIMSAEQSQTEYALHIPGFELSAGKGIQQKLDCLRALALHGRTP